MSLKKEGGRGGVRLGMGKNSVTEDDSVLDTPRSSAKRKQLPALDVTTTSTPSGGAKSAVSPRSVSSKSPKAGGLGGGMMTPGTPPGKAGGLGVMKLNMENGAGDSDPEYVNADITADELRQIEQVLRTSEPRLQELYKKVGNIHSISIPFMQPFLGVECIVLGVKILNHMNSSHEMR